MHTLMGPPAKQQRSHVVGQFFQTIFPISSVICAGNHRPGDLQEAGAMVER